MESNIATPPKRRWVCPICDVLAVPSLLTFDTFAQSILDKAEATVTEVLVNTYGDYTVSQEDKALAGTIYYFF